MDQSSHARILGVLWPSATARHGTGMNAVFRNDRQITARLASVGVQDGKRMCRVSTEMFVHFEPQVVMYFQSLFLGLPARIECRWNDCAA